MNRIKQHIERHENGGVTISFSISSMDEPLRISSELLKEWGVTDYQLGSRVHIGGFELMCIRSIDAFSGDVLYWPIAPTTFGGVTRVPDWFKEKFDESLEKIVGRRSGSTHE